jgi:sugar phosphate isomerase/epimerase
MATPGKRPMEMISANTPRELMLQLDVGTCVEAGSDPVAWIRANPGRINSIHCKDWAGGEGKGYRVLFGEGDSPWRGIFEAAEAAGGVEYYLIEQEGSRFPEVETAEQCLATWRKMRG